MTRLEHLSQFSNAVLSPELNVSPLPKSFAIGKPTKSESKGELSFLDEQFRQKWCEKQFEIIGEFGAVLEVVK